MSASGRRSLIGLGVAFVTAAVFRPALRLGFLGIDDPQMVFANPHIRGGLTAQSVRWAFTTTYSSLWHPLTWLSYMADVRLFGPEPFGFHLTDVLLHAASAGVLFVFLDETTDRPWESAFAALLFSLHPLRVESVAWAAERKDALSVFFFLATLLAYARYARRPSAWRYAAPLGLYVLALLSKPMVVTLPVMLLIVDFWPLERLARESLARLLIEKLPFAALAAGVCLATLRAQAPFIAAGLPLSQRLLGLPAFYAEYLGKIFWPSDLSLYYRRPVPLPVGPALAAAVGLAAATVLFASLRKPSPYLLAGWLWFLSALLPVVGLVQITGRSIANRFTYLPQIGLCFAAAWAVRELLPRRRPAALAGAAVLLACAAATRAELSAWQDPRVLYERTLREDPRNELFCNILGVDLAKRGDFAGAEGAFKRAIALAPSYADARNNLGLLYAMEGRRADARRELARALRLSPGNAQAAANLARLKR